MDVYIYGVPIIYHIIEIHLSLFRQRGGGVHVGPGVTMSVSPDLPSRASSRMSYVGPGKDAMPDKVSKSLIQHERVLLLQSKC